MALDNYNYVKFRRGTPAMFTALAVKDPDSLYFVVEQGATQGKLYLGDVLIASVGSGELNDLEDILLSNNITANSLLIYDGTQEKWVNKPLSEILGSISGFSVMTGATASTDGASGLVPQPLAGDEGKFLKGDGTWVTIPGVADISQLQSDVADLQAVTTTIIGSDSNKSMREVAAEEVAAIVADAPDDLDTLQEIAAWINDHPDSASDLNNRLTIVEGDVADLETTLATLESQQIQNTGDIADLESELAALKAKDVDLQSQIDVIDNRLKWQAISDDTEEEEEPQPVPGD